MRSFARSKKQCYSGSNRHIFFKLWPYNVRRFTRFPSALGRVPCRELLARLRNVAEVKTPMSDDRVPDSPIALKFLQL